MQPINSFNGFFIVTCLFLLILHTHLYVQLVKDLVEVIFKVLGCDSSTISLSEGLQKRQIKRSPSFPLLSILSDVWRVETILVLRGLLFLFGSSETFLGCIIIIAVGTGFKAL